LHRPSRGEVEWARIEAVLPAIALAVERQHRRALTPHVAH
jgi:hypothetical protein